MSDQRLWPDRHEIMGLPDDAWRAALITALDQLVGRRGVDVNGRTRLREDLKIDRDRVPVTFIELEELGFLFDWDRLHVDDHFKGQPMGCGILGVPFVAFTLLAAAAVSGGLQEGNILAIVVGVGVVGGLAALFGYALLAGFQQARARQHGRRARGLKRIAPLTVDDLITYRERIEAA